VALCRSCRTVIPCHCHLTPPPQIKPGVYLAAQAQPAQHDTDNATHRPKDDLAGYAHQAHPELAAEPPE
jgi:hypothetical protein